MVTAGGKNVAPAVLEDRVRAHSLVSQCMVVGDGKPFIAALVTIDPESLPGWLERNGQHGRTRQLADLVDDPTLRAEIQSAVDDANKAVSKAESIRKFVILPEDWTEEGGQLTPSLKLKRNVVLKEREDDIAALYEGRHPEPYRSRAAAAPTWLRRLSGAASRSRSWPATTSQRHSRVTQSRPAAPIAARKASSVSSRASRSATGEIAAVDDVAGLAVEDRVRGAARNRRRRPAGRWPTPRGTRCRAPRRPGRGGGCGTASRTRRPPRSARQLVRRRPAPENTTSSLTPSEAASAANGPVPAAADDQQRGAGDLAAQPRQRPDQGVLALAGDQPRNAHDHRPVGQPVASPDRRAVDVGPEGLDVDARA